MKASDKLRAYWEAEDQPLAFSTRPETEIAALEARYAVILPADFRDYLLSVCPSESQALDNQLTDWWSLERIKSVSDEYSHAVNDRTITGEADKYLFFADYSFWCWAWAINCGDGPNRGRVAVIGGSDRVVAGSFSAFVEQYVIHPSELFPLE